MITLVTDRLVIRNFLASDADALYALIDQYEDSAYALYDHQWPTSLVEIVGVNEWFARGDSYLAVDIRSTSHFIGFVALDPLPGDGTQVFNLGYIFDAGFHHQGYAMEACQAVLDYAFGSLAARQVVSNTASVNRPSCQLLECLGFHKTAEAPASLRSTVEGRPIEFVGRLQLPLAAAEEADVTVVAVVGSVFEPAFVNVVDVPVMCHPAPDPVWSSGVNTPEAVVVLFVPFIVTPVKAIDAGTDRDSDPPAHAGMNVAMTAPQELCGLDVTVSVRVDPDVGFSL